MKKDHDWKIPFLQTTIYFIKFAIYTRVFAITLSETPLLMFKIYCQPFFSNSKRLKPLALSWLISIVFDLFLNEVLQNMFRHNDINLKCLLPMISYSFCRGPF